MSTEDGNECSVCHWIHCQCEKIKNTTQFEWRFYRVFEELNKRFPMPPEEEFRSDRLPEDWYLAQIDQLISKKVVE